jgi:ubiquinone/menaquinone biosynthesis C-methylase UbiE
MKLEPTGERMIMEHYKSSPEDYVIYLLHVAAYRFAEQFTRGKRVLDLGCGSGYGSAQTAQTAAHVTAVDVAEDVIAYARNQFASNNLEFRAIDPAASLPFGDASFDVVLSFQVLEHVSDTAHYLSQVRRVLAPQGQMVLVTPDRSTRLLPLQRPWNRWHVHEYSKRELGNLLARHFDRVEVLGMTAKPEMIGIELRRCNRVKWLMLPFTVPVMPDRWRVAGLNMIHRLRSRPTGEPGEYSFTIDDVQIDADAAPSVNLVALAS